MAKPKLKQKSKKLSPASWSKAERSRSFRPFIAAKCATFAALPESDQNALARLLYRIHIGRFSHNSGEPDVFPYHWKTKQRDFGSAAHFDHLNDKLGWLIKVSGAKIGESAEGWIMANKARQLLIDFHEQGKQQHRPFYNLPDDQRGFSDRDNRPCRKPQSPIASKAANGTNTKFKPWSLPINVTIDGDNLHAFLHAASARLHGKPCPAGFGWAWESWDEIEQARGADALKVRLSEAIAQAGEFLRTAWVSKLEGFVVYQCYHESTSGRLIAEADLNLQSCHREVRQAALPLHHDYDVECCHPALLASLANRQGFSTPTIAAYIRDKKKLRIEVQMVSGGSYDDAKRVINALTYGAQLTSSPAGSIAAMVGQEAATRLCSLKPLVDLNTELKAAGKAVIESYRGEVSRTGKITNAAGRRVPAKGVKANKLLSHILTGAESEVLKVAIAYASADIVLLAHDGFVTSQPIDQAKLEERIRLSTGHNLTLKASQFAPPGEIPGRG